MIADRRLRSIGYGAFKPFPLIKRVLGALKFYVRTKNRRPAIPPIEPATHSISEIVPSGDLPRLFYDISALSLNKDARGIHRVVINVLKQLSVKYGTDFLIITVRSSMNGILTCDIKEYNGEYHYSTTGGICITVNPGDVFLSLDLYRKFNFTALQELRRKGLKVYFIIYDLLDIRTCCLGERDFITRTVARTARQTYRNWLHGVISVSDGVICDSRAIVNELLEWLSKNTNDYRRKIPLGFFHLGADFRSSRGVDHGISVEHSSTICIDKSKPNFLMVGVMDPHKGHIQTIHAFEQLWGNNIDVNLIIVGKEGALQPHIGQMIRRHAEYGYRLHWYGFVDDDVLSLLYDNCTALLAASFSEGFGLPLIEAAHHKLPIIARDIPVFREVAGSYAYFFKNNTVEDMAESIISWLSLANDSKFPESCGMPYLDWSASTRQLMDIIMNDRWSAYWSPEKSHHHKFKKGNALVAIDDK